MNAMLLLNFHLMNKRKNAYESNEYQSAKKILGDNKDRIFTIVEGTQ